MIDGATGRKVFRVDFPSCDQVVSGTICPSVILEEASIHIWGVALESTSSCLQTCREFLHEDEVARAARLLHEQHQNQYILAHGCLRAVLSRYLPRDPGSLTFRWRTGGKPFLASHGTYSISFSLTHSHGRMLVAVAQQREVGADLEQIRDKVDVGKLADRFYAPSERKKLAALSGLEQAHQFYRYWVAKEAALKGQGVGLVSLQQCEIIASDEVARAEVHLLEGASMQPGWNIQWLDCGPGWVGAVSAHGSDWIIRVLTNGEG
jgi:4'-phosphopantetheinyl transferase